MTDTDTGARDTGAPARRLFRLLLVVALALLVALRTGHFATVSVILAVVAMVMLHELGHFLTAKWAGMKVTEFFFGFGPRLWSVRKGETEYGVKAIPVGGYVRIIGMHNLEEVDPADEPRTYRQKPYWRRMSVALAGSTMHFLIAFVLLYVVVAFVGIPRPVPVVREVLPDTPAAEAGFEAGDRIVAVDGREADEWTEVVTYIRERPGEELSVVVERDGQQRRISVTPEPVEEDGERFGRIGLANAVADETVSLAAAVPKAGSQLGRTMWDSLGALASFFSPSGLADYADRVAGGGRDEPAGGAPAEGEDDNRLLSLIGFGQVAAAAADEGIFQVLVLLVLINVFVGIFNLIPLLPLDGGHVAIATYEAIRSRIAGRRYFADVSRLLPVTVAVVFVLIMLGATSLWLDIVDPIANPFE
jgi:membrane-associated protease RseP (regulator of RpoE activity)